MAQNEQIWLLATQVYLPPQAQQVRMAVPQTVPQAPQLLVSSRFTHLAAQHC